MVMTATCRDCGIKAKHVTLRQSDDLLCNACAEARWPKLPAKPTSSPEAEAEPKNGPCKGACNHDSCRAMASSMAPTQCSVCGVTSDSVVLCKGQGDVHLCPECVRIQPPQGRGQVAPVNDGKSAGSHTSSLDNDNANGGAIVCELLCFICNKIDTLAYDILLKLCVDFYTDEQVAAAKSLLFDTCVVPEGKRNIQRRGSGKKASNIQDMLDLLLDLDSACCPVFVARDLANLPPLTVDHFDMSKFAKDLESLRTELHLFKSLQEGATNHLVDLVKDATRHAQRAPAVRPPGPGVCTGSSSSGRDDSDIETMVQAMGEVSITQDNNNHATDSGTGDANDTVADADFVEAGTLSQMETTRPKSESSSSDSDSSSEHDTQVHTAPPPTQGYAAAVAKPPRALKIRPRNIRAVDSDGFGLVAGRRNTDREAGPRHRDGADHQARPHRRGQNQHRRKDGAGDASAGRPQHNQHGRRSENHRRDFWSEQTGQTQKKTQTVVVGTGRFQRLRAATEQNSDPSGVFVSRLHKDTTSDLLTHHIQDITGLRPRVLQLKSRRDDCRSFRIIVPDGQVQKLLDTELWPNRVIARPYKF